MVSGIKKERTGEKGKIHRRRMPVNVGFLFISLVIYASLVDFLDIQLYISIMLYASFIDVWGYIKDWIRKYLYPVYNYLKPVLRAGSIAAACCVAQSAEAWSEGGKFEIDVKALGSKS